MKNYDFSGDYPDHTPPAAKPEADATAEPKTPRHMIDPASSYAKRQAIKDQGYEDQYKLWTSQKSPEELKDMKALGLDKPLLDYVVKGKSKHDSADSPAASYEPDIAAIIDGENADGPDNHGFPDACEALRHFIAEVLTHSNTRLTIECLALIFNLDCYEGDSMTDIAKRHEISVEAVSKRCWNLCEKFKIPPSRAMYKRKIEHENPDPESP